MSDNDRTHIADAMRWALAASTDPALASADWIASDINPSCVTVEALLTDPEIDLIRLRRAKSAFKTMRVLGETARDRRLGARLYAASIAAGIVWHQRRVSAQSDQALRRAFHGLLDDADMPQSLRDLAGRALCELSQTRTMDEAV